MLENIPDTPFYLSSRRGAEQFQAALQSLERRVETLRTVGDLTSDTLRDYYGEKRFEQIAESNAMEGSTLSVGETELAVIKGVTISGHDPGYSRDARSLAAALDELVVLARDPSPTDISQVKRLHELLLEGRTGAGEFRTYGVQIRGAAHVPPQTWSEVMKQMEQWENWSQNNSAAPPVLRAAVLHAWLVHIHPFGDGNGRTARAITNLELVRAGYPPLILRKNKDRDQYLDALGRADNADLGAFADLIVGRADDALRDLERAAQRRQSYDLQRQQIRLKQESRLAVWNAGVHLLCEQIKGALAERSSNHMATVEVREFNQLAVDDFIDLCESRPVRQSWAFRILYRTPGMPDVERLAWAGTLDASLRQRLAQEAGRPALLWSVPNPDGYPPWKLAESESPGGRQMTIHKDRWLVERDGNVREYAPSELAAVIADDLCSKMIPPSTL